MPDTNTVTATSLVDTTSIKAAAEAQYAAKVIKELTTKYSVVAKRKSQLASYNARMDKLFGDFDVAIAEAGENPAKVMEVLEKHKFPASVLHFTPSQQD